MIKVSKRRLTFDFLLEVLNMDQSKVPGDPMDTFKMISILNDMRSRLDTRFGALRESVRIGTADIPAMKTWMDGEMVNMGYSAPDAAALSISVIDSLAVLLERRGDLQKRAARKTPKGRQAGRGI